MSAYARARTMYAGLPNLPSLFAYPQRNWKEAAASAKVAGLPSLGVRLADLAQRLQVFFFFKLLSLPFLSHSLLHTQNRFATN